MEIIELTAETIERYLDDCMEVQAYLVKPGEPVRKELFVATANKADTYFVGVLIEGRVRGLGVINKIVWPVRTAVFIDNIVVHPDARGQGLFTAIMDALEAKAVEWGAEEIALTCSRELVWPLYEKRGYDQKNTRLYLKKVTKEKSV